MGDRGGAMEKGRKKSNQKYVHVYEKQSKAERSYMAVQIIISSSHSSSIR